MHDTDSADHAAHLARRTALAEGVHAMTVRPVLHGDNGATLKGTTVLAMLHWLGIEPSYSRPRVSDDNPYAEAVFRTAKYRPEFPVKGFVELDAARKWAARFVDWYNNEHRHSGIKYVTPAQRHAGQDRPLLTARHELYQRARHSNPRRWSRQTRDWTPVAAVTLNPERDTVIQTAAHEHGFPVRPKRLLSRPGLTMHWHGAQRRGSEERSHPEPRAARLGASTVAHSSHSEMRLRTPKSTAQRLRHNRGVVTEHAGTLIAGRPGPHSWILVMVAPTWSPVGGHCSVPRPCREDHGRHYGSNDF